MSQASENVDDLVKAHSEPEHPDPTGSRWDTWFGTLLATETRQRLWYWGAPAAVTLLAAGLRLWDLGNPHQLVFDETYYVKDSYTLMHLGYESSWPADADKNFNAGDTDIFTTTPSFVAHPPFGKWLISLGLSLFGAGNSVGWRISIAVIGILAVVLIMLIARKMFASTLVAVMAGFLMAVDGTAIALSRVALLDNAVMFFALLAFGAVLLDRDWQAARLAALVFRRRQHGVDPGWGPVLWWRPWLVTAGILLGLTSGIKWSGMYFLAAFGVYVVLVDAVARRRLGIPYWFSAASLKQAPATLLLMVPVAALSYLATWTGWLVTSGGYYRHWVQDGGPAWGGVLAWVPVSLQNLWHYQAEMYNYHINLHTPHPYQANPLTWLLMTRPTSMYYAGDSGGTHGCAVDFCSSAITSLGNPFIWWAAAAAALYLVYRLIRRREWQVGLILTGLAAGYLPWMLYLNRTVFQFYTIAFEPYLVLGLAFTLWLILGKRADVWWKRLRGIRLVGTYFIFVTLTAAFFYPLASGIQTPFWFWQIHMWLPGWR
ncbi:MAG: phospholipid carrier-dependent glycosyltransferase [Microbacteriaceae bacterium]